MIRLIVACDEGLGIGQGGKLPWPSIPDDMSIFRKKTMYGAVIMGRRTWEALDRKPLSGRFNVVMSRTAHYIDNVDGLVVARSVWDATLLASFNKDNWIIGGAELYKAFAQYAEELHITRVRGTWDCDTFLDRSVIDQFPWVIDDAQFDWGNIQIRRKHNGPVKA